MTNKRGRIEYTYTLDENNEGVAHQIGLLEISEGAKIEYFVDGTYTDQAPSYTEAGTYELKYRVRDNNEEDFIDYEEIEDTVTVYVASIPLVFGLAHSVDKSYDGYTVKPEIVISNYSGSIFFVNIDYFINNEGNWEYVEEARNYGSYKMNVTVLATNNYKATTKTFTFTISKTESRLVVDESSLAKTYDGSEITPIAYASIKKANDTEDVTDEYVWVPLPDDTDIRKVYYNLDGSELGYVPTDAGTYKVKFILDEANDYQRYESKFYTITIGVRDLLFGQILDANQRASFTKSYDATKLVINSTDLSILVTTRGTRINAQGVEVPTTVKVVATEGVDSLFEIIGNVRTVSAAQNIYLYASDFEFVDVDDYIVRFNGEEISSSNVNIIFSIVAEITEAEARLEVTPYSGIYDEDAHGITIKAYDKITNELISKNDYKIVYSTDSNSNRTYSMQEIKFANVGSYTVYYKVVFNNYATIAGSSTITIEKADPTLSIPTISREYNGYAIANPVITTNTTGSFTYTYLDENGNELKDSNDKNYNPIVAGNYKLRINLAADSNFNAREKTFDFVIEKCTIVIDWSNTSIPYTGYVLKPTARVITSTYDRLIPTVTTNTESIEVGEYIAYVSVDNDNYVITNNTKSTSFSIIKNTVDSLTDTTLTYTGNEIKLEANEFYDIKFIDSDNNETKSIIDAGEYKIIASLKDKENFEWSSTHNSDDLTVTLTISQLDITSKSNIEVDAIPMQSYTSLEVTPEPVVRYLSSILTLGEDYILSYRNNVEASAQAVVRVTGIGNFKGYFEVNFTIYSTVLKLADNCPILDELEYRVFTDAKNTTVEEEHNYYDKNRRIVLVGIKAETTITELINMFDSDQRDLIKFYNASSRIVAKTKYDNTFVGSGSKVQLYDQNGKLLDVLYLVVNGDLNGDGLVNASDQTVIQKIMMGRTTLTYEKFLAGDLNRDGLINGIDLNQFSKL